MPMRTPPRRGYSGKVPMHSCIRNILRFALAVACAAAQAQSPETPLERLPYTPGLDVSAMDRGADPCVDFYRYACGGWQAANPIPPDQASWDVYRKMAEAKLKLLDKLPVRILGAVLNDISTAESAYKYYRYVYGYTADEEPAPQLAGGPAEVGEHS